MNKEKIFEAIKESIINQLSVDESKVTLEADLKNDLNADSANLLMMVMDLEEAFSMQVEDDAISSIKTVGDIVDYVASRV